MSWMQKLYETYDHCAAAAFLESTPALVPLSHVIQQAHLEIALDGGGNFRRAHVIPRENTVIPATEKSATARTSAVVPHPLCDHLKYCAGDFKEASEGENKHFEAYHRQLKQWCESLNSHRKAIAVLKYIEKRSLVQDLVREGVLPVNKNGQLLTRWDSAEDKPPLFQQLVRDKDGFYKPQNALIRWIVESSEVPAEVWKDLSLQQAWQKYSAGEDATAGICMVTGENRVLATKHPRGIRGGKDGAKLISWKKEEDSDFIYLGRFLKAGQVAGVGKEVSEKAHGALRWLIERQGYRNGDQVVVAWAVSGKPVPDPFQDSLSLFQNAGDLQPREIAEVASDQQSIVGDVGQAFALRLNKAIAGYRANLDHTDDIVVLALDSASRGRMAITLYRELTGSEFLDRIQAWHESFAWHQDYRWDTENKKPLRFIGAPSPRDIADAAFGRRRDKDKKKLHKLTVERLLPCIIDGRPLPRDLMESAVRRTCNRAAFEKDKKRREWEWEKNLGIACALFKGFFKAREYHMTLETDRTSRDYLYGRLLAIAEHIEGLALWVAGESRDTTAAKLMQRFSDRPYSTWRLIEPALTPYKARLRAKRAGFLVNMEKLLDEVITSFVEDTFLDDRRLSGEFLLGYHCQRRALNPRKPDHSADVKESTDLDTSMETT